MLRYSKTGPDLIPLISLALVPVLTAILFALQPVLSAELKDWENPALTGINNEAPHASMIVCPDAQTAKAIQYTVNSERVRSPFYRSLNGDWKYHYSTILTN